MFSPPATVAVSRSLDATDRCDRCTAQAYVEVLITTALGPLPLLFCAHHHRQHHTALTEQGTILVDETARLATTNPQAAGG